MHLPRIIATLLTTITLSNCSAYKQLKDNEKPDLTLQYPIEQNWISSGEINDNLQFVKDGWIAEFQDAKIRLIADTTLKNNQDLKIAAANVEAAEASAKKAGAALKPKVDLNIGDSTQGDFNNSETNRSVGASVDIAWEVDVWGRIAANEASALSNFESSKADYQASKESLIAQSVKAYLFAIETYQMQALSISTANSYAHDLKIIEAFYKAGASTIQDVYIAKSNLAGANAELQQAKNSHLQSLRSLELLLGQYPSGKYDIATNLPNEPKPIAAGIPSDILELRPDLKAAERNVAAAFNQTTSAKAAKLPRISLTSSIGTSSNDLNNLSDPTNIFWNLAGNLLVPLFDNGTLQNDVEIAEADQLAAIAAYQSATLNAFNDVETALSNEATERKRIELLSLNYEQAKLAYEFSNSKYLQGEGNILDVSQLMRSMVSAQNYLISAKQDLLSQRVNLYLALGIPAF